MKTGTMYRILKTLLKYAGKQDFTNELISAKKLRGAMNMAIYTL